MKQKVNLAIWAKRKERFFSGFTLNVDKFKQRRSLRYVVMLLCALTLGIGNAWGLSSSYYTAFTATTSDAGKGLVYSSGTTSTAPTSDADYVGSVNIDKSGDTGGSDKTNSYYAWAKAARGYEFDGWTISGSNGGVSPTSSSTQNGVEVKVTSNVEDGTNTGTAIANWKNATSFTVTYGVPVDGTYSITYSYTVVKDGNFSTEEVSYTMTEASTIASGQITSYAGDNVTVTSNAVNFDGWYDNASFIGDALSISNTYSFTLTGTKSIYAKFKPATKYYGKVIATIPAVPYSMPGGGKLYVSAIEGVSGATFTENEKTAEQISYNIEETPPASINQTFYLYAQPNDRRYVFRGWYNNAEGTGDALSTSPEYAYTFAVSSRDEETPTIKHVYACFDFNLYYVQVEAAPAISGQGMVIVTDTRYSTTPEYTAYSNESSVLTYALRSNPKATVYLYAKGKYGYKLAGWYDNAECTGTSLGSNNPLEYKADAASIYPMEPTIKKVYAKFVAEDMVNVTYNLPDQTKGEYTASALDIVEVDDEWIWGYTQIYTSEGKSANSIQSQYKTDVLMLEAEPKSGYGVTKWYDGGDKTSVAHLYNTTATTAKTVGVTFGDAKPFKVGDNYYVTLSEALTAVGSSGQITVVQNAYVAAGNYTIPKNVTLLVPFNDAYTCYKEMTGAKGTYASSFSTPSVYVTLTLGSGANVILNGEMSVSATMCWAMGSNGSPSGKYGLVRMNSGSTITLKSGSKLYAWGYITGEGVITAESGSHTYEGFQVTGYRGGNATSGMAGNSQKVFPMNQYYIQNIENKITFQAGALEHLYMGVTSSWGDEGASLDFIGGPSSTNTLFLLKSGATLTKWYDPSKDRQKYELNGDATLDQIVLDVASVSSKDYVLPLTNNMDLDIVSGTTTINYDVAIFPDVNIHIRQGAQITIKKNVYVYDTEEWSPAYAYAEFTINDKNTQGAVTFNNVVRPIKYTTMTKYSRTSIADAKIVVDGTLNVASGGKLYTTSSGANICSENSGVVQIGEACSANSVTYQAVQSTTGNRNTIHHYDAITVTPAKLHNADDSYTATAGAIVNDQFIYSITQGKWLKNPKSVTWDARGGTTDATTMAYSQDAFLGVLPAAKLDGCTFNGWFTETTGGAEVTENTKVTANVTYYAHWTPNVYNITYKDQGKAAFSGTHIDSPNAHPTTHTYGTATTLNGVNDKADALFGGWHTISNCKAESRVTSLGATDFTKDITLYAKWIPLYTLTVEATPAGHGTVSQSSVANVPEGSAVTTSGNTLTVNGTTVTATPTTQTAQYTYAFDHWNNVPATVTAAATIQAVFTRTTRSYNVTFNMKDHGSAIDGQTKEYGSKVDKPSDPSEDGYTFVGWYKEDACTNAWNFATDVVTGETTLFAKWTANEYTITFDSKGGSTVESITQDYGTVVTAPANPTREGYTFNGWNPAVPSVMPANNVECVAQWTANTNTAYTVKHYQQNIENDEYTEVTADRETKQGTTATATAATAKTYTGFTAQPISQGTIAGDGTTVVNVYYDRNTYTVTWDWNESGTPTTYSDDVKYGAAPVYTHATPTKPSDGTYNYTFTGWSNGTHTYAVGAALPVVTAAITYTAQYAQVNLDLVVDDEYELPGTTAVTNVTVTTDGILTIDGTKVLTATNLILQATTSTSGQIIADETNLNVINAYFDLTLNAQTRTWYGVGVPWRVNAQYGIYGGADKDHLTLLRLGKDFDIIWYSGTERASRGPVSKCYKYLEDIEEPNNRIVDPGRMYFMFFARPYNVIRFKKIDGEAVVYQGPAASAADYSAYNEMPGLLTQFTDERTDKANWNWHGIANPNLTYRVANSNTARYAYRYKNVNIDENKGWRAQWDLVDNFGGSTYVVGQPVMIQIPESGYDAGVWTMPSADPAPLRKMAVNGDIDRAKVQLTSSTGLTDRIVCAVDDEAKDEYTLGSDLVKMTNSEEFPQLWINNYKHALAVNTVRLENSVATYPLTIVSPKAGDYTLSLANKMADGIHVYLTLNGEAIADLTEGEYVLTMGKETSKAYGIRLVRGPRGTVTAIDEALEGKENVEKVVKDGVLYIIRQGNVYDASGRKVE